MIRLYKIVFVAVLPLAFLWGCAEEPVAPPTPKRVNVAKPKAPAVSKAKPAVEEKKEEKKIVQVYSYDPAGKSDPFFPYLAAVAARDEGEAVEEEMVPLTELEKYALTQFKLVAVMAVGKKKMAMVEDPMGVGHSLRIGTLIGQNKGKVVDMKNGIVFVEEKSRDIMGDLKSSIIELAIETSEGGKK